jgi:DNA-binding response OmpR family regulator
MVDRKPACRKFAEKRVLVVEYEFLLSDQARKRLEALDCRIAGPTMRTEFALALLDGGKIDAAILDLLLDEGAYLPLVERLEEHCVPYVFAISDAHRDRSDCFPGFTLSERTDDLDRIARCLFR